MKTHCFRIPQMLPDNQLKRKPGARRHNAIRFGGLIFTLLVVLPIFVRAGTGVTYVQQPGDYSIPFTDGTAGDFNQNGNQLGMYANSSGNKQVVAWRSFKTAGDNSGSARKLQVGDVFAIGVSATRAYGQIGFSLNAGGTQSGSWANRQSGSRLSVNLDGPTYTGNGTYGSWYATGNSTVPFGDSGNQTTYHDFYFTVLITSTNTADVTLQDNVGGTLYHANNLTMNGTANIDTLAVYLQDDWDGGASRNIYWEQPAYVTNSGYVNLGYFLSSGTFTPGLIVDGLDAASTSTTSANSINVGGNLGTMVILSQPNSFTGSATVNANATALLANNTGFGSASGGGVSVTSGGGILLSNSITVASTKSLALNGAGAVGGGALENINGNNTWSGAITLGSATRINSDIGLLTLNSSTAVSSGFNLTFGGNANIEVDSAITTGANTVTKDGNGTLTLTGANTYSGGTVLNSGILSVNSIADSGTSAIGTAGTFTLGGGTLSYTGSGGASTARSFTATAGTTSTIDLPSGSLSLSGQVSSGSAFTVTKSSAGTLTLSGGGDNAFLQTTVNAGTLVLNKSSSSSLHALGGTTETINGGTLQLSGSGGDQIENGATVSVSGGTFDLNALSETIAGLSGNGGTVLNNGNGSSVLTLGGTTTYSYSGTIADHTAGSGTLALTKSGAGTQTLSGNNSYSGGTTLSAGQLNINSATAIGNGTLTVSASSTIDNTSGAAITLANNNGLTVSQGSVNLTFPGASDGSHDVNFGSGALTFTAAGPTLTVNAGTVTFGGATAGLSRKLTKAGAGTLVLSSASVGTWSGGSEIDAGTLAIGNDAALGTGTLTLHGGTIQSSGGTRSVGNPIVLSVNSGAVGGSANFTFNSSGTFTASGAARTLTVNNSGTTTLAGNVYLSDDNTTSGRGLTITGTGNTTISGAIANNNAGNTQSATLTMSGSGTLTLSGNNSYTGNTTISGGNLTVASGGNLGSGSSVTVASSASLTVNNSCSVAKLSEAGSGNGGTASIGSGATLTVNGNNLGVPFYMNTVSGSGTLSYSGTGTSQMNLYGSPSCNIAINSTTLGLQSSVGNNFTSPQVSIASGATFDVSAYASSFALTGASPQQTLAGSSSSGTATVNIGSGKTFTLNSGALVSLHAAGGASSTLGKISVTGNLTLNANATTINVSGSALAAGTYRLMDCTGTLTGSANATPTITGTALSSGYTAVITTTAGSAGHVDLVVKATPTFSGLSNQTISYGTGSVTLNGTLSSTAGPTSVYPANGDTVSATINGHTVNGTVNNGTGGFSIVYNDASLATDGVTSSPYTVTYVYAGNSAQFLNAAGNDTSTTLTVTPNAILTMSVNTNTTASLLDAKVFVAAGFDPATAVLDSASGATLGTLSTDSTHVIYTAGATPGADTFQCVIHTNSVSKDVQVNVTVSNPSTNTYSGNLTIRTLGSGMVRVIISGTANQGYTLQHSGDLSSWTGLQSFTMPGTGVTNFDFDGSYGTNFYRTTLP